MFLTFGKEQGSTVLKFKHVQQKQKLWKNLRLVFLENVL